MATERARALLVGDIMTRPVLTAAASDTVAEAAARMHARRVGSVVVVEGDTPVGILTERDLVAFAAGATDARTALVGDYMTGDPDTVQESEEVIDAFRRLAAHGYRHIPVVAAGKLVGIITMRDLIMKLRRGPAAAAHGAVGPSAAVEALPPVASDVTSTLLSLLDAGRATVPAVVVPDGPELSYRALRQHVGRVADTLASLGLARGDRVGIVLGNSPEAVVAILGAAAAAAAVPLNPAYTEDELRYYLEDVSARALIVPRRGAEAARRAWAGGAPLIEIAVAPHEIDEALLRHPAVAEAVSFGVPHGTWGEVVEAAVVLRADATEAQLLRHCRVHLADFKIPTRLHLVESVPKGSTGKIQRARMPSLLRGAR